MIDGNFVSNIAFVLNQIEVYGGVNDIIAKQCKEAGADLIIAGGFLLSKEPSAKYQKLREAIK